MKKFYCKKIKCTSGFGLLEVVLAAGVLITVIAASVTLGKMTIKSTVISLDRVQAYNLAQEGMELVRQIRDTNWVSNPSSQWSDGLVVDNGHPYSLNLQFSNWRLVDYNSINDITLGNKTYRRKIYIETPETGTNSVNSRLTQYDSNIVNNNGDILLKVRVNVEWDEYGQTWSNEYITYLSDWKPAN